MIPQYIKEMSIEEIRKEKDRLYKEILKQKEKSMKETYHYLCKECEHLYHCFGRNIGIKIQNDDVEDMYLSPDNCRDFYPERKQ